MNRKTQAQRDAINARADAHPRPLSSHQREALRLLSRAPLYYCRAGWGRGGGPGLDTQFWASSTVLALEGRGFCSLRGTGMNRSARITPAGRRELARHRGAVIADIASALPADQRALFCARAHVRGLHARGRDR